MSESHAMTWKEFKDKINSQDIPDNATIEYIDFSYPEVYPGNKDGEGWKSITVFYNKESNTVVVQ